MGVAGPVPVMGAGPVGAAAVGAAVGAGPVGGGPLSLSEAGTFRQKILLLPRIWVHWQISYFLGFPCIMAIAGLYVHYIGIDAFNPS